MEGEEGPFLTFHEASAIARQYSVKNQIETIVEERDDGWYVAEPTIPLNLAQHPHQHTNKRFLGIDFGTTNCSACAENSQGELELIELEPGLYTLPTALYVPRIQEKEEELDQSKIEERVARALREENERYRAELEDLEIELLEHKPPPPRPPTMPTREHFRDERSFDAAVAEYEYDKKAYPKIYEEHQINLSRWEREIYTVQKAEKIAQIRKVPSVEVLRDSVVTSMKRDEYQKLRERYQNQSFFKNIHKVIAPLFGSEAISAYIDDPSAGFLLKSPKAFLGADLKVETPRAFLLPIQLILKKIKESAERQLQCNFDGVVLGRPINYQGPDSPEKNVRALNIMRKAAEKAGFSDIHFFFEPVAAAIFSPYQAEANEAIVVADIGGGTTDVSLFSIDQTRTGSQKVGVAGSTGQRIGGNDFDQAVAWNCLMPTFGKDQPQKDGKPLPNKIPYAAICTRDLPQQQYFKNARWDINQLMPKAKNKACLERLITLQENDYQHLLILKGEEIKISATSADVKNIDLGIVEAGLSVDLTQQEINESLSQVAQQVAQTVISCLQKHGANQYVLMLTGGMSSSNFLTTYLKNALNPKVIVSLDPLLSVVQGLGQVARELSQTDSSDHLRTLGLS